MSTSAANNVNLPSLNWGMGLRLSLTTATPVTTSDVTGATTIYLTPYTSGAITLYNGSNWISYTTNEVSLALGTLTNNTNYDVFASYSSGVGLSLVAWSSDTARATALVRQNGILVKSGTPTNLYVGTIRTTATTTTEDSIANRYVYNYFNRTPRKLKVISSVNSWTYATAAYRQADASTANQFNYVSGDPGGADALSARLVGISSGSATLNASLGIGIDSTTVNSADMYGDNVVSANVSQLQAVYDGYPGLGKHTIAWLEYASAATVTFYGNVGASTVFQSGMTGLVWQ